jgi:Kef-type K+ transport system membrane component KefB
MVMGMVFANIEGHEKLFKQLNYFSPPILLLFFVRSGLSFDLSAFTSRATIGSQSLLLVAVLYFVIRLVGKYVGAYIGALVTGKSKEVRRYLGLALAPQAGVAIGLAALVARQLGPDVGGTLQTIILASSVLYELIGPASAKLGLYLSGSYDSDNTAVH